jgi:hypothetical protein
MVNYDNLKCCYEKSSPEIQRGQIEFLEKLHNKLMASRKNFLLNKIELPTNIDFQFFSINYGYLISLLVEINGDARDVFCLNIENAIQHNVSVFSRDGIVRDWKSIDDFIEWVVTKSGYLA